MDDTVTIRDDTLKITPLKPDRKIFDVDPKYIIIYHMGVSKNRGTPKWMVYNGKPY